MIFLWILCGFFLEHRQKICKTVFYRLLQSPFLKYCSKIDHLHFSLLFFLRFLLHFLVLFPITGVSCKFCDYFHQFLPVAD